MGKYNRLLAEATTEPSNNNLTQESVISKEASENIEAEAPVSDNKTEEIAVETKETTETEILDKKPEVKEQTTTEEVKKSEEPINTETKEVAKSEEKKEATQDIAPVIIDTPKKESKTETKVENNYKNTVNN